MFQSKRLYILIITAIISVSTIVAEDTVDITILIEMAKANTKEQKFFALEYINYMLENNKNIFNNNYVMNVIYEALKYLAFEGTVNTAIEGYTLKDFPNIRREAVKLLGQLGIKEARITLIEVLKYENDMLVLHEAIRALFLNRSDFYKNEVFLFLKQIL